MKAKPKPNRNKGISTSVISDLEYRLLEGYAEEVEEKVKNLLEQMNYKNGMKLTITTVALLKLRAIAYKDMAKFMESIDLTEELIKYYMKEGLLEDLADCYLNQSINCHHLSRYNEALKYLETAKELYKKLGDEIKLSKYELNLGLIYYLLGYYDEGYNRIEKASRLFQKCKDQGGYTDYKILYIEQGLVSCIYMRGVIALDDPKRSEAIVFLLEAEKVAKKKRLLGYIFKDLGRYYLKKGEIVQAEKYLNKSVQIRSQNNFEDPKANVSCQLYLALLKGKKTLWVECIHLLNEVLKEASRIDALDTCIKANEGLFIAYDRTGNEKEAILALKNYLNLRQIEYDQKHDNRVQLEHLLPLNDRISELEAELKEARKAIELSVNVISKAVQKEDRITLKIDLNEDAVSYQKIINKMIPFRESMNIKDAVDCFSILNDRLQEVGKQTKLESVRNLYECTKIWLGKEEELSHLYDGLIELKLINDKITTRKTFFAHFTGNKNGQKVEPMIWEATLGDLAFFFRILYNEKLISPDLAKKGFYNNWIIHNFLMRNKVSKEHQKINTTSLRNEIGSSGTHIPPIPGHQIVQREDKKIWNLISSLTEEPIDV